MFGTCSNIQLDWTTVPLCYVDPSSDSIYPLGYMYQYIRNLWSRNRFQLLRFGTASRRGRSNPSSLPERLRPEAFEVIVLPDVGADEHMEHGIAIVAHDPVGCG